MATTQASAHRRGEVEYNHLTAVIFNQILSGTTDFKRSDLIPWMQEARTSPSDRQRISLLDRTLNQMMKDDIICHTQPVVSGGLSIPSKKYEISPSCKGEEVQRLKNYTTMPSQDTGYQWIKTIFKGRNLTQAMTATLDDLEFYLQERKNDQSQGNKVHSSQAAKVMSPTFQIKGVALNGSNTPIKGPGDSRHRALSVGSDTTNESDPKESALTPPQSSRPFSGSPAYKSANPAQRSRRLNIGPNGSTESVISTPAHSMTSDVAVPKGPSTTTARNLAEANAMLAHAIADPNGTPPIPAFVRSGLALLHEKYPDDDFNPTLEDTPGDLDVRSRKIWLIKCNNCDAIYRPSYTNNNFNVGNFETHLKNMKHSERVMAKLAQQGKVPKMTSEVRTRLDRYSGGQFRQFLGPLSAPKAQLPSKPNIPFSSTLEERQLESMALDMSGMGRSRSVTEDVAQQLIVTLGPCEGLKKRPLETTPQLSENGDRKRPRLNNDTPLAVSQRKNAEAYARIDALEAMNQNIRESAQQRSDQLDTRFQDLANFHKTLVEQFELSKQKISDLDRLAQASTSVFRMHDGEIEDIKKAISAMPHSSQESNLQIETVVSKALEMEQTIKNLQELCASYNERLDGAAVVEKELMERIKMVQKLALRQSEAMKAASKEKEETEKRFARLEAMIARQSTETVDGGSNEAIRTISDQRQAELERVVERVEVLERESAEKNIIIRDLEARISRGKGADI